MFVTNFVFLQITNETCYVIFNSPNAFDNNIECVDIIYDIPNGNKSLETITAYDFRWVYNNH